MEFCQLNVHIKNLQHVLEEKLFMHCSFPQLFMPSTHFIMQRYLPLQESALSCHHIVCKNLGYYFCILFCFGISTHFAGSMEAK